MPPEPKQPPKQPKTAYILNVPIELIILFAQNLQLFDQYRLAQVSTGFRSILKKRFDERTIVKTSDKEWLIYLTLRAFSLPNHWVCEECNDLHPYDPEDNPSPVHLSGGTSGGCPRRATTPDFTPIVSPCSFHFQQYHLHHRHVQLALKYHRMGGLKGPFAQRLSRLLAGGTHLPMTEHQNFSLSGFQTRGIGRYSWQPKIVGGRFLLMTKIEFYPTVRAGVWTDLVPAIRMCQHQMWMPLYIRRINSLVSLGALFSQEGEAEVKQLRGAVDNGLHRAVAAMRWAPTEPVMVSCPRCATDIAMQWSIYLGKHKFTAVGWHDFGPETSPVSVSWLSKHLTPTSFRRTPCVQWQPGRVKELWDSCP
ncbi:hypothetical protein MY11210_006321 [Beauveria gryllotalpidicola]